MIQAFPEDTAPEYLLRDQDKIYGADFSERVQALGSKRSDLLQPVRGKAHW
jgi:hypothetical protein